MNNKPIHILLVEDNPADAKLTKIALNELKVANQVDVVKDGVEALLYLRCEGRYSQVTRPDLVLLDLSLPRKSGLEVLSEIKRDEALKPIPVVILTTSKENRDILETYSNYANSYITKPVNLEGFATIVKSIESFWFTIVKLPPH